jgi:hypothetical protein
MDSNTDLLATGSIAAAVIRRQAGAANAAGCLLGENPESGELARCPGQLVELISSLDREPANTQRTEAVLAWRVTSASRQVALGASGSSRSEGSRSPLLGG